MEQRTRDILAANINALIQLGLQTHAQLVTTAEISNGTLGRIRNGEVNVGVDHIGRLATAFGLDAWQLLVPDLTTSDPAIVRAEERAQRRVFISFKHRAEAARLQGLEFAAPFDAKGVHDSMQSPEGRKTLRNKIVHAHQIPTQPIARKTVSKGKSAERELSQPAAPVKRR